MDVTPSPEEFKIFFEKSPALCMAISPEFIILAASEEFLRATMTKREAIVGKPLFEVFPENPERPDDDGVKNLRKSLTRVLQSRKLDVMPVQKYDIRKPESEGGKFEVRYWSPVNAPVLDAQGIIQYIILRTEDVTEFVRLQQQSAEQTARFQELHRAGQQMELEVFLRTQELKTVNLQLKQANEELAQMKSELESRVAERTAQLHSMNQALEEDLEERKQIELALSHEQQQLRVTLESLGEGVFVTDAEGQVQRINRAAETLTGLSREVILGRRLKEVFQLIQESTGQSVDFAKLSHIYQANSQGPTAPYLLQNSQSEVATPIDLRVSPLIDDSQNVVGTVFTIQDVSDRRRVERMQRDMHLQLERQVRERTAELLASEERFRLLIEGTKEYAIYMLDTGGLISSWNPGAERIKGYTAAEVIGQHFSIFYPEVDRKNGKAQEALRLAALNGRYEEVGQRVRKDGNIFWADVVITALRDASGRLRGFSKITRDITKAREAEELEKRLLQEETARRFAEEHSRALWQERERLRVTLQSIGDGVIATDVNGLVQILNPVAQSLTGWTEEEAQGHQLIDVFDIVNEETRIIVENPAMRALRDGLIVGLANHTVLISKDGSERPIADSAAPIRDPSGKIIGVVLVFRDMTESKKLEGQFRQAQKMEAIGRLAGGVAHDFNNLLTVILSYAEYLADHAELGEENLESVQEIRLAGERAASLTRQLLAFSRQQILHPKIVNLNEVVIETSKMLGRIIGEDVLFSTKLHGRLWQVLVDQGQMEQVLMNLAVNARDAMPAGGKLTVETSNIELDDEYVRTYPDVKPGHYVLIAISDTGIGMDETIKNRMFEPYFTTKEPGKGTGLGLATVFGIVKQSGGHITVYSEPNLGTSFKIYIPRVETPLGVTKDVKKSTPNITGTETILVVEDEPMVRKLACRVLRSQGYTVLEAENGVEALKTYQQHRQRIQLLLTDVVMPEMGGRQLSEEIHLITPELKVLFMSGYTNDAVVLHGVLDAEAEFLQKPFSPVNLAIKVREVLDKLSPTPFPPPPGILLVDDEPAVRKSTAVVLRSKGFHVIEASSGEEALKVSAEYAGTINLLLTDVNMPRMSGEALSTKLRESRPDLKVLFMSGDTSLAAYRDGEAPPNIHFVAKPSSGTVLVETIRKILSGESP